HGPARGLGAVWLHEGRIANRIANRGSALRGHARATRLGGVRARAAVAPAAARDRLTSRPRAHWHRHCACRSQFLPKGVLFMKLVSLLVLCLSILVAVAAAGQLAAQTTTIGNDTTSTTGISPTTVPGLSASPAASTETAIVLNLVEITRMVPAGPTAGTAFTVPP